MSTIIGLQKLSPKQQLLATLNKIGGLAANRKALKDLQTLFTEEIQKPNVEQLRKVAWRTK
ncbi:MAG: hypothetical protein H7202_00290 [Pedobacter sp.]|nr:hypothetical protein [Pedobacter sp.]